VGGGGGGGGSFKDLFSIVGTELYQFDSTSQISLYLNAEIIGCPKLRFGFRKAINDWLCCIGLVINTKKFTSPVTRDIRKITMGIVGFKHSRFVALGASFYVPSK